LKNNLKFLKTAKLFLFKLHTKEDEKFWQKNEQTPII
jgi:hypothetical protein